MSISVVKYVPKMPSSTNVHGALPRRAAYHVSTNTRKLQDVMVSATKRNMSVSRTLTTSSCSVVRLGLLKVYKIFSNIPTVKVFCNPCIHFKVLSMLICSQSVSHDLYQWVHLIWQPDRVALTILAFNRHMGRWPDKPISVRYNDRVVIIGYGSKN